MLPDLLFLLFATGLLAGAIGVVAARNPMYCVLGIMAAFVNAAGLFMLFNAEFLGLLIIMVYVGAIAVMFLFVLMTIDIDFSGLREGFAPYLPVGLLVAGALLAQFLFAAWAGLFNEHAPALNAATQAANGADGASIKAIGNVLFTTYALPFQAAGLILLTAMIGAIVLTHRKRGGVRRQDATAQILRRKSEGLVITKPKLGAGVATTVQSTGKSSHWQPLKAAASTSTADDDE